jgi:hypothetical protein
MGSLVNMLVHIIGLGGKLGQGVFKAPKHASNIVRMGGNGGVTLEHILSHEWMGSIIGVYVRNH